MPAVMLAFLFLACAHILVLVLKPELRLSTHLDAIPATLFGLIHGGIRAG